MAKHPAPDPGVDVITSVGGQVVFASDAALATMDRLRALGSSLHSCVAELRHAMSRGDLEPSIANSAPYAVVEAHRMLEDAMRILTDSHGRAIRLRSQLERALQVYTGTERAIQTDLHAVDEGVAWLLGREAASLALPALVLLWPLIVGGIVNHSGGIALTTFKQFLSDHPGVLNNRYTVAAIRELASDADGFESGLVGLPLPIATALDESGVLGVKSAASDIIGAASLGGLFVETPVSVKKTSEFDFGSAPTSLVDRAESFPIASDDPNGEQIRIVRYDIPGKGPRFDVFVGGTADWNPKATNQPFDLTSDVQGVAGHSAGSVRAVEQVLAKAGVTKDTPIVLNGYSQGGLVAAVVAASGNYNVHAVVTFGAPSGQVPVPPSIPVLAVRNKEDIVPALDGYDTDTSAVIVERSLFDSAPPPPGDPVAAHRLSYYQQTAAAVDQAQSSEIRGILSKLNSFGDGAIDVQSTMWLATRTKP